jgi:hypothetical protein
MEIADAIALAPVAERKSCARSREEPPGDLAERQAAEAASR